MTVTPSRPTVPLRVLYRDYLVGRVSFDDLHAAAEKVIERFEQERPHIARRYCAITNCEDPPIEGSPYCEGHNIPPTKEAA